MIGKRYRNNIISMKTYPVADNASIYIPVVTRFRLTLKRAKNSHKNNKIHFTKLKIKEIRSRVVERINNESHISVNKNIVGSKSKT